MACGQTGVSQRVHVGFLRSCPPAPHRISLRLAARLLRLPLKGGVIALGARASLPHAVPLAAAELPCDAAGSHPCRREQQRPGRSRAMAPFPVDPSGGDGPGCARLGAGGTPALPGSHHCAGGTPALPGSLHPMISSHQGDKLAKACWCRLSLKEVHLSSGLFVFIRVHSWFVFINDPPFFLE